jgi:alpha,alpha-trehalose phosphorylase
MIKRTIEVPPEHVFPPDEWRVIESQWTDHFNTRAESALALSNGYLGVRGCPDEGVPVTSPGTFINGFHETWPIVHAEDAYGLARTGQTMVNVPDATVIQLYVDDEPLYLPTARTREYRRVLDMRDGVLTRELTWSTPSGKHVTVRSTRLVSFEHRHVLAVSYEVTTDLPAPITISSRVVNGANGPTPGHVDPSQHIDHHVGRHLDHHLDHRVDRHVDPRLGTRIGRRVLEPLLVDETDGRVVLGYRTVSSGMTLALAVDHELEVPSPHHVTVSADPDRSEFVLTVDAEPNVPIRMVKYAAYQTSRSATVDDLAARCRHTLDRIRTNGFAALVDAQRANLDRFWDRADVTVEDTVRHPVRMQQAVRWNLFHLAQATWRAEGAGIPAKGLTGDAYDGHYFWDTETWVLPFLAYTQPRIARNLLRFRHSMLPSARARARELKVRGALFPWRTIRGDEASAYYQAGTAQFHLNADIAYAIRRYLDVRDDDGFIAETGAEMLVETARSWIDLGFYGEDDQFHIHGVTGPDEYTAVVDDNAYTNLMARLNLHYAATTMRPARGRAAGRPSPPRRRAARRSRRDRGVDPSRRADVRAARPEAGHHAPGRDVPLARALGSRRDAGGGVPAPAPPSPADDLPTAGAQAGRCRDGHVPAGQRVHAGAEAPELRVLRPDHHRRLVVVGEHPERRRLRDRRRARGLPLPRPGGARRHRRRGRQREQRVHIASAAGAWMGLVFGFGGVRDFDGQLAIDPRLPARFRSLGFSLRFHDRQLRLRITHEHERYELTEGEPLDVVIRGRRHQLVLGAPLEVAPR